MEIKSYVLVAVSVITAVVVFGACLPVFADTVQANDTFTNEGYYRISEITADTEKTIEWDHTNPTVLTVDGEEISFAFSTNYTAYTFFASDNSIFRFNNEGPSGYKIQKYGGAFASAGTAAGTDVSITISGMDVSYTFGETTGTFTVTEGYVIDKAGTYIMKDKNTPAYIMPDDSIICLAGVSSVGGTDVTLYAPGTVEDGLTFTALSGVGGATYSVGTPTFNYAENSDHIDLIELSSIVFDFTRNDATQTVTYSYFIVPYEVTAERTIHPTGATLTLMELLPVLIAAGLIVGVVGAVIVRRM